MGAPQKDSFDVSKGYKSVLWIAHRDAQDWGLNESEMQQDFERARLANRVYKPGAIAQGMNTMLGAPGVITVSDGMMQIAGRVESVPGAVLTFDAGKTTGVDTIYARWLLDQVTAVQDPTLVSPATGDVVEERLRAQITLTTSNPDALDEAFETWNGNVPLGWTVVSGTTEKGYPSKFGETSLQLNHVNGTETQVKMVNLTLTPSADYSVYLSVRTVDGQPDLSIVEGAHCKLTRSSPSFTTADFGFATLKRSFVLKPFSFTADANTEQVEFKIIIPDTAPTTKILVDAVLVTATPLGTLDLERHFIPALYWDRETDIVTRAIDRTSNLKMAELEPPLDGRDIINIDLNRTLQEMLALRIFDGHGNFRVPPALLVRRDESLDTGTHLGLRVKPGRGYVAGFPVGKSISTPILIPRATTTAFISGEGQTYALGAQRYPFHKAVSLDDFPIKEVSVVNATVERTVTVTRGGVADGSDALGLSNVLSILAVTQGTSAAILDGTVSTTFTFTPTTNTFTLTVANYDGTAGSTQTIVFARGVFTIAEVIQALATASGRAYRSGKITGNVVFTNNAGVVRIATKTISDQSTILIGSANANTALGFTNAASATGVGTTGHGGDGRFVQTTDWVQSGNSISWAPTGGGSVEPANGTQYSVTLRHTINLAVNVDFVLGGKFASQLDRYYKVVALGPSGEGIGFGGVGRVTPAGSINLISWTALANAESYNVYRSDNGVGGTYNLLMNTTASSLQDDGVETPNASQHPTTVETTLDGALSGGEATVNVVSTAGFSSVNPSTAFIEGSDVFTYTGLTGTSFTGCTGVVAHPNGATVRMGPNATAQNTTVVEAELGVVNLAPSGTDPVDGTVFLASYEYYQPRTDQVIVDRNGTISTIAGVPADLPLPPAVPDDVMALAQVQPRANGTQINIVNYTRIDRPTVMDLRVLFERVQRLFENDIIQQQINQIADVTPTAKKGIVADAQANASQHDTNNALYALNLDTTLRIATVPHTIAMATPAVNAGPTTAVVQFNDRTIPSTEVTLIHQSKWSELTDVNEFAVFRAPQAVVALNPSRMSWSFQTTWASGNTTLENILLHAMAQGLIAPAGGTPPWITDLQAARLGASRQLAESLIQENAALVAAFLMRQTTITVTGVQSLPLEDNIAGTFASQPVTLTPVSPTVAGTAAGTIKADDTGRWTATFTIPLSVALGVHDFRAKGSSTDASASFEGLYTASIGSAPQQEFAYQWYTNQGYGHADQFGNFIPGWDPWSCPTDPLAQSIFIDSDQTLSAVGLWFGAKDATLPIIVQLRNVNGGYPGAVVLASKVLKPSEITLNVETKVTFDEYVTVPANRFVCIVLISSANTYRVQTATLRKIALSNAGVQVGPIMENPYPAGVLFTSSNLNTWTPKQETDLRMKVYGRTFSASAVLEFSSASITASDIFIGANQRLPAGTDIKWEYELNGDAVVRPFNVMEKRRLDVQASSVIIRARLFTNNPRVAPAINMPSVGLVSFMNALAGTYITRMVEFTQNLVKATLYVNAAIPATTTLTWSVSNDDGVTWESPSLDSTTAIDGKWNAYVLTRTFTTNTNKKLRVKGVLGAAAAILVPEIGAVGVTLE